MVIGFDASRVFIGKRTGTENYSYQILSHLIKLDHTNKYYIYTRPGLETGNVLSSKYYGNTKTKKEPFILNTNPLIQIHSIPFPRLWTQAGLAWQTFIDPLNTLFVPAHTLPLIRKPGLKTVVTVHDLGAEYLPSTHQLKQRLYLNYITHHQLKSATHLIAVSQATKDDLIKKVGIPEDKITVIYEGYNKELFKPVKGDQLVHSLSHYNLEPRTYFLFVGTIQPRKNLVRLITAYGKFLKSFTSPSKTDPVYSMQYKVYGERQKKGSSLNTKYNILNTAPPLVLAGSKGWLSDEIYDLPKKLGIETYVKFLGYVPDEKLPSLYSGAQAFLYPSLFEGFGLPILEAMACGCPVLTSNISSCPEVAGKAAILVDPYSVEDITRGVERIMNQELRIKNIKAGFEQIKKFSWEKSARETLKILEKLGKG